MKKAILGTNDYHQTMQLAAKNGFQRMAGYLPLRMPFTYTDIPSVHPLYIERVDAIMQVLTNNATICNCSPRSPYLLLAWWLIGPDNPYRLCQYSSHSELHYEVAMFHIRIALGDVVNFKASDYSASLSASSAAWCATQNLLIISAKNTTRELVRIVKHGVGDDEAISTLQIRALQWANIDDAQALYIAKQLILELCDRNARY